MSPELRRSTAQVIVGVFVVAWGVLLTLSNFGLIADGWVGWLFGFWPLLLVGFGFGKMLSCNSVPGRIFGGLVGFVGLSWTIEHAFGLHIHLWHWWPLIIVAVGVLLVMRAWNPGWPDWPARMDGAVPGGAPAREFSMFSGLQRRIATSDYRGAQVTTIAGGVEYDLRGASTVGGEAVIDLLVILGGVQIRVPPDWTVINHVTPILGGVEEKSTGGKDAQHRLVVRGHVILGGVEIRT